MTASIPTPEKEVNYFPNRAERRAVQLKIKRMNKLRFKGRSLEQIAHITGTPIDTVRRVFGK